MNPKSWILFLLFLSHISTLVSIVHIVQFSEFDFRLLRTHMRYENCISQNNNNTKCNTCCGWRSNDYKEYGMMVNWIDKVSCVGILRYFRRKKLVQFCLVWHFCLSLLFLPILCVKHCIEQKMNNTKYKRFYLESWSAIFIPGSGEILVPFADIHKIQATIEGTPRAMNHRSRAWMNKPLCCISPKINILYNFMTGYSGKSAL